jgi:hypothetical protein
VKYVRTLAPLGAVLALACASSAQAATGTPVTVRVEGKSRTLLASTVVHVRSGGWLTRGGAPRGACSTATAAGALDKATHHRWGGPFTASLNDYEIFSILGETHNFTLKTEKFFWEIFVGNKSATSGACGIAARRGMQLLFAAVPEADFGAFPVAIKAVPHKVRAGHAFTVKVVYYDLTGKPHPLGGAVVTAGGNKVTTNSRGLARITASRPGKLVLKASHADITRGGHPYGYIRAAAVRVTVQ